MGGMPGVLDLNFTGGYNSTNQFGSPASWQIPLSDVSWQTPMSSVSTDFIQGPTYHNSGGQGIKLGGAGGGGGQAGYTTMDYANAGIAGLQTLGSLWGAWQQAKMAKKQFKFGKEMALTNLAHQMKTYNTALSDRARSRGFTEGQSQAQIDSYVADNRLERRGK